MLNDQRVLIPSALLFAMGFLLIILALLAVLPGVWVLSFQYAMVYLVLVVAAVVVGIFLIWLSSWIDRRKDRSEAESVYDPCKAAIEIAGLILWEMEDNGWPTVDELYPLTDIPGVLGWERESLDKFVAEINKGLTRRDLRAELCKTHGEDPDKITALKFTRIK